MLFISFRGKDDLLGMYCYFPVILLVNFVKVAPVIVVTLQKGLFANLPIRLKGNSKHISSDSSCWLGTHNKACPIACYASLHVDFF